MSKYHTTVLKFDAAEVADEVEEAMKLELQLRKGAREKMLEAKKAEHKENVKVQKSRIHAYFDYLKDFYESPDEDKKPAD